MKTIAVKNEVACLTNASGKKRVINKEETLLALEKQQKTTSRITRNSSMAACTVETAIGTAYSTGKP